MTCRYDSIYYNGVTISGFSKSSLNSETVKADDGVTIKYIRNVLDVEFVIAKETTSITSVVSSVDREMDYIRSCLSESNKSLNFGFRGAGSGEIAIGTKSSGLDIDLLAPIVDGQIGQHGFGVVPEILKWEPIVANQSVKCQWRCVFYTAKNWIVPTTTTLINSALRADRLKAYEGYELGCHILSVSEDHEIDIDDRGLIVSTLKGVIEVTNPEVTTSLNKWGSEVLPMSEDWISKPSNIRLLAQEIVAYLEPYQPKGFKRDKQKFTYNKSTRQIEYVIIDKEIENPEAVFPRILEFTAYHSVGSDLLNENVLTGAGFLSWDNTFEGSFKVAPGYWLGWAWVAMMVIVKQRIERSNTWGSTINIRDEVDGAITQENQNGNAKDRKSIKPKHLLHSIRIKEHIHERRVDLSLRYVILSDLNKLFENTGLFTKVNTLYANMNNADPEDEEDEPTTINYDVNNDATYGITPEGNPSDWVPIHRVKHLDHWKHFAKKYSQNTMGYSGLGLANYNVIFDPDNPDTTALPYNRKGPLEATDNRTTTPKAGANTAYPMSGNADTYAARRRTSHFTENDVMDEVERGDNSNSSPTSYQKPITSPGKPIVDDLNGGSEADDKYPGVDSNLNEFMSKTEPDKTWIDYKTEFTLVEKSNSTYMPTIQNENISTRQGTASDATLKSHTGFTINGKTGATVTTPPSTTGYDTHRAVAHGKPVYYIRFRGKALRAGYAIPTPVIHGLANGNINPGVSGGILPCYRVGTQIWRHRQVAKSADIPIFEASWDMTYAVVGDPSSSNIQFKHPSQSEFA